MTSLSVVGKSIPRVDGLERDGTIVAREMRSVLNVGAYLTSAINVTRSMTFEVAG